MQDLLVLIVPAAALGAMLVPLGWGLIRIRSWSMYPTLHTGAWFAARRLGARESIRRGDIILIESAELGRRIVKRVIGLPGETLEIGPGEVRIDGTLVAEPYLGASGGSTGRFYVPKATYFVLGDNRPRSSDSRSWTTPFVPRAAIRWKLASALPSVPKSDWDRHIARGP